jgi:HD-GYP domain-containing protein (c-di-GMP phosphodiesterase class II)/DNA-binding CsgD family transcriptional regulator
MSVSMARDASVRADQRLAECLASLSLATDLGTAFPLEKALRNALLAIGIGRQLGLTGPALSDVYYMAMLRFLGCSAFAHELAAAFGGDDNVFHSTYEPVDFSQPQDILSATLLQLAAGSEPLQRVTAIVRFLTSGRQIATRMQAADCEAADRLATRLGLSDGVRLGLAHVWTRWDGRGNPPLAGEAIAQPARISLVANLIEIFCRLGGREAAVAMVRKRRGADLDPAVVDAFLDASEQLLTPLGSESVWEAALEAEPEPRLRVSANDVDAVAGAFGDFADLKFPSALGHSAGVARLAETAARAIGLPADDVTACRRAGLVHDLGRVSVPNSIWDKTSALTPLEWERVRLHPYYTERVLAQSAPLRSVARLAGSHHERCDGSGYHRAVTTAAFPVAARIVAAADCYQALTEPRPYREALSAVAAERVLESEASTGRFDPHVVHAVLEAAGHVRRKPRPVWPSGLSDREVGVLRLVARGKTDKEIGRALVISDVTVHHHVRHIYDKIGVTTRAGAALFAMEHELIQPSSDQE